MSKPRKYSDIKAGDPFGSWVALEGTTGKTRSAYLKVRVRCACGTESDVAAMSLWSGKSTRCYLCSPSARPQERDESKGRWTAYGLSRADYEKMLAEQGGVCKICLRFPGEKDFHIDHDHRCCPPGGSCGACVRGLLCGRCNTQRVRILDELRRTMGDLSFQRLIDYVTVEGATCAS